MDLEPIDIPKIVAAETETMDAWADDTKTTEVVVPRAQYRAMLLYITQRDQLFDALAADRDLLLSQVRAFKSELKVLSERWSE